MRLHYILTSCRAVFVATLLASCGGGFEVVLIEPSVDPMTGDALIPGFLGKETFATDEVDTLTAEEAVLILQQLSFLRLSTASSQLTADEASCEEKENIVMAFHDRLFAKLLIDSESCEDSSETRYLQLQLIVHCTETDLSSWDKSDAFDLVSSAGNKDLCPEDSRQVMFQNLNISNQTNSGGRDFQQAIMTSADSSCTSTVTDGILTAQPCRYYSQVISTLSDGTTQVQNVLVDRAVSSGDVRSNFFSSGSANLTINDWTGTVTFGEAAPQYQMTRGSEQLEGTITDKP